MNESSTQNNNCQFSTTASQIQILSLHTLTFINVVFLCANGSLAALCKRGGCRFLVLYETVHSENRLSDNVKVYFYL